MLGRLGRLNYSDTTQNPKKGSFLEGKWDPITSGKSRWNIIIEPET